MDQNVNGEQLDGLGLTENATSMIADQQKKSQLIKNMKKSTKRMVEQKYATATTN